MLIGFVVIMLLFHLAAHSFASQRPHLDFAVQGSGIQGPAFGLFDWFGDGFPGRRDFIVDDSMDEA